MHLKDQDFDISQFDEHGLFPPAPANLTKKLSHAQLTQIETALKNSKPDGNWKRGEHGAKEWSFDDVPLLREYAEIKAAQEKFKEKGWKRFEQKPLRAKDAKKQKITEEEKTMEPFRQKWQKELDKEFEKRTGMSREALPITGQAVELDPAFKTKHDWLKELDPKNSPGKQVALHQPIRNE